MRFLHFRVILCLLFLALVPCNLGFSDGTKQLRLKNGSFGTGEILAGPNADELLWQADGFNQPLRIALEAVRSISPVGNAVDGPKPKGHLFETKAGGMIVGQLVAMTPEAITVDTQAMGRIEMQRDALRAMVSAQYAGKVIHSGPTQDGIWANARKEEDWVFEGGAYVSKKAGGTIVGSVGMPAKARVSMSLSWTEGSPDFVIAIGTDANARSSRAEDVQSAARLEVWDREFALVRETESDADIRILDKLELSAKRLQITFYIDQVEGRVIAFDQHGRLLDKIQVKSKGKPAVRSAIHISNIGALLQLERVEVREWDGFTTSSSDDKPMVLTDAGEIEAGIVGFDPETRELMLEGSDDTKRLPLSKLLRGLLVSRSEQADEEEAEETVDAGEEQLDQPKIELLLADRSRLNGHWLPSVEGKLSFESASISEAVHFPPKAVLGLIGSDERYTPADRPEAPGTLKLGQSQFAGFLAPSPSPEGASENRTGLYWHVIGAMEPSEIVESASGGIVYRKAAIKAAVKTPEVRPPVVAAGIARFLQRPVQKKAAKLSGKSKALEISFRTGDIIFGEVSKIDEKGVHFKSNQSTTEFAPHEKIQSVDLAQMKRPISSDEKKLERLMTVPRSMKLDPPTHLLIAKTGDPLRVRLNRMTSEFVEVEVKLELVSIPRENVAKVIWLHDRQWENEESEKATSKQADPPSDEVEVAQVAEDSPFQIHVIRRGDRGLTFVPSKFDGSSLVGASDLLGDCSVEIEEVDQLLFGKDISVRVREYREDPWVLALAQYPKVFLEDEEGAADLTAGKNSQLVGKAAPAFGLEQLDGEHFRLTDHRDRIVVLDFWASWCGPCMQTMPKVDEIVEEIGSDKVHLVAVNLQEPASRVEAALERLNIAPTVLLDRDGEVAAAYDASAIPQTVIIDRQGVVQHLFVGGGSRFAANFRAALEELTSEAVAQ